MRFDCPHCRQQLEIENERAGACLPCPACEQRVRVPRAPVVLYHGRRPRGLWLVPIPVAERLRRSGALAERVEEPDETQCPQEPMLL